MFGWEWIHGIIIDGICPSCRKQRPWLGMLYTTHFQKLMLGMACGKFMAWWFTTSIFGLWTWHNLTTGSAQIKLVHRISSSKKGIFWSNLFLVKSLGYPLLVKKIAHTKYKIEESSWKIMLVLRDEYQIFGQRIYQIWTPNFCELPQGSKTLERS